MSTETERQREKDEMDAWERKRVRTLARPTKAAKDPILLVEETTDIGALIHHHILF